MPAQTIAIDPCGQCGLAIPEPAMVYASFGQLWTLCKPCAEQMQRPDQWNRRGGPVCAICGGSTRWVLPGKSWCDACGRYQ